MTSQFIFFLLLSAGLFLFTRRILFIRKNILSGRDVDLSDQKMLRWKTMARVAMGQSKMTARPVAGVMHILIYVGFVIINIEMVEIVIDGLLGTHRIFSFMGPIYNGLIGAFEVLAAGVILACVVFFIRRNVLALARLKSPELRGWPSLDANIILVAEILLMFAFLSMNAADGIAQGRGLDHFVEAGSFPVSQWLMPLYSGLSDGGLIAVERGMWWFHITGVLAFLVYVPYSKHFHIMLAFPNTYYSNLRPAAAMDNMPTVTKEVQLMMDPTADPYATPAEADEPPARFGVKDATDLTWKQLMDSYSCTECGRCTSECPANQTGKLLSPRKIIMDTRDRIEEIGKKRDANGGQIEDDGKSLLGHFITEEELWACTSCQACVQACPINISPMGIILDMRRSLIMEDSKSPESITSMFNNIENNGAPWAFPAESRSDWTNEL
ncbi:MAG: 4Fe-4S dicluster domain-containing protein [Flavobacteriales bacterium]|nr:4Fe-4S dicluster domain-containing protein [Flavobacteriales bacterium]